jgi:hypothetical protein
MTTPGRGTHTASVASPRGSRRPRRREQRRGRRRHPSPAGETSPRDLSPYRGNAGHPRRHERRGCSVVGRGRSVVAGDSTLRRGAARQRSGNQSETIAAPFCVRSVRSDRVDKGAGAAPWGVVDAVHPRFPTVAPGRQAAIKPGDPIWAGHPSRRVICDAQTSQIPTRRGLRWPAGGKLRGGENLYQTDTFEEPPVHDQFDITLEDSDLLGEVELTTDLMIAATRSDLPLSPAEIDHLLGVAPSR